MSTLPDEIISEILSPALKVPDELFSDTSNVSPFATYSPSTSAYLLVCKDWLRVATPLLYNVVVLRSKAQANALELVLRNNPDFGRVIRKLRVEGGYGPAMHTILKSAPNITDICLTLAIWSSDSTQGLCKGLPLINPHRVIVVDSQTSKKPLKNQPQATLMKVLFDCVKTWDNLRVFGFPYGCKRQYLVLPHPAWNERALAVARALKKSAVHTVILSDVHNVPVFLLPLLGIPSLRTLQFKEPLQARGDDLLITAIIDNPQLKAFARYTLSNTQAQINSNSFFVPDIPPSLNPSFSPMISASEETRERVWKRVLFFAMYVEELQSPSFSRWPNESHPSRLPLLQVSKYFNRLALPYLYYSPYISLNTVSGLVQRLKTQPDLGSFIRYLFIHRGPIPEDSILTILSCATNLKKFGPAYQFSLDENISDKAFQILAQTTGATLREFSNRFYDSPAIPKSVFAHFSELRVLELHGSVSFDPSILESPPQNVMINLHTLTIDQGFLELFSTIRLVSLHTLKLGSYIPEARLPAAAKLLNMHKDQILHLSVGWMRMEAINIFDVCKSLVDIKFGTTCNFDELRCETTHESLARIVTPRLMGNAATLDPTMFPALRVIQVLQKWPTTERDISKSTLVSMAEILLQKNISLTDSSGKSWVPRMKISKRKM